MYAIIEAGGRQWKVEPGTRLDINRIAGEVGSAYTVDRVLFAHSGDTVKAGTPFLSGAAVVCEVVAHHLGPKVLSYHYRRRENWRKTVGHRQPLTALVVKEIRLDGKSATHEAAKLKTGASPAARVKAAAGRTPTVKAAAPKLPSRPRGTPSEKPAPKRTTKE